MQIIQIAVENQFEKKVHGIKSPAHSKSPISA